MRKKRALLILALAFSAFTLGFLVLHPRTNTDPGLASYNKAVRIADEAETKLQRYRELPPEEVLAALDDITLALRSYANAARGSSDKTIRAYANHNAALLIAKYVNDINALKTALSLITAAVRILPQDEDILRNHELLQDAVVAQSRMPSEDSSTGQTKQQPMITGQDAQEISETFADALSPYTAPPVTDDGL